MPYSFRATRYGAISYSIRDLTLDNGERFSGELYIEPDDSVGCEDWYIYGAVSIDEDSQTFTTYNEKNNSEIFTALCRAVYANSRLCMAISDEARM